RHRRTPRRHPDAPTDTTTHSRPTPADTPSCRHHRRSYPPSPDSQAAAPTNPSTTSRSPTPGYTTPPYSSSHSHPSPRNTPTLAQATQPTTPHQPHHQQQPKTTPDQTPQTNDPQAHRHRCRESEKMSRRLRTET